MFRPAARALARAPTVARGPASTRLISTGPAPKSRSWKNTAVRLGLAVGAVYYYNTSNAFAQEPSFSILNSKKEVTDDSSLPTLDSITPKIRQEQTARSQPKPAATEAKKSEEKPEEKPQGTVTAEDVDEMDESAAFNPETGEINWDCPCLGGMAHGPCGEEFKAAFSCFVYSQEEPKGIECIDKFKGMQDCFRQHPEVYGAELEDDEVEGGAAPSATETDTSSHPEEQRARAKEVHAQVKADNAEKGEHAESEALVPKAAHDAEDKN
ncbi:intermembrane space import and assembly protein 40 [Penicillium sp. IBT 18751x]|nr:intermembrane space import and assembly protein 40 [Penicillium sp. IBT 18751x]